MRVTLTSLALALLIAGPTQADQTHSGMAEGIHAEAEIHAIDGKTVNLTHDPIPEIGWPAMTMDLQILENAEVDAVAPGDRAVIMLEKGPDGLYGIRAIEAVE